MNVPFYRDDIIEIFGEDLHDEYINDINKVMARKVVTGIPFDVMDMAITIFEESKDMMSAAEIVVRAAYANNRIVSTEDAVFAISMYNTYFREESNVAHT